MHVRRRYGRYLLLHLASMIQSKLLRHSNLGPAAATQAAVSASCAADVFSATNAVERSPAALSVPRRGQSFSFGKNVERSKSRVCHGTACTAAAAAPATVSVGGRKVSNSA